MNFTPSEVEVRNGEGDLYIQWKDGHESVYPLFGLRKNCPCVECRGGHSKMGSFDKSMFKVKPTEHFEIENAKPVGNHALRLYWSDGHNTGMYQWETLRKLCPCEDCYDKEFMADR